MIEKNWKENKWKQRKGEFNEKIGNIWRKKRRRRFVSDFKRPKHRNGIRRKKKCINGDYEKKNVSINRINNEMSYSRDACYE